MPGYPTTARTLAAVEG